MNKTKTSNHINQTSIEKSAAIIVTFTLIAMLGLSLAPASAFAESKDSNHSNAEKASVHNEDNHKTAKVGDSSDKDAHFAKVSETTKVKFVELVKLTDHDTNKKVEEVKESVQSKVHEQENKSKDNHNCENKDKNVGGVVDTNDEPAMVSIATTSAKTPAVLASTVSVAKTLPNTGLPAPLMLLASALMSLGSMLTGFGLKLRKVSK